MDFNNSNIDKEPDFNQLTSEIFDDYPEELLRIAYILCVIFILIGVPANLITIIALAVCRKFRNATAIFIINLHISNLLFCCVVLPVTANTFSSKQWVLGKMMCSVYPLMKYSLNCIAHFTVVAITINRYIIICHPRIYPRIYKRKYLIMTLISMWVIGFSLFLPSYFGVWGQFARDSRGGECTLLPDKNKVNPKLFFLIIAFVAPYTIFILCYSRIWWTVRKAAKKRSTNGVAPQPSLSKSSSDPSVIEKGNVGEEIIRDESCTEDDASNTNSPIVFRPEGSKNTISKFFRYTIRLNQNKDQAHLPTRKDKKLATMIVAIMVSFTLCHLPILMLRILYDEFKSHPTAFVVVHLMEYSSVFLSPLIYVIMSSEYRRVYLILFKDIKIAFQNLFNRET